MDVPPSHEPQAFGLAFVEALGFYYRCDHASASPPPLHLCCRKHLATMFCFVLFCFWPFTLSL